MRPDLPFPQIATGDLDVAVVGQLPPPNLPLSYEFEPSPVKMVGFEAAFRHRGLWKQDLENASGHPNHTLIAGSSSERRAESERTWASGEIFRECSPKCRGKIVVSTRLFSEMAAQCHGMTTERYFADMRVKRLCRSARR
jgi:hypothetical protein